MSKYICVTQGHIDQGVAGSDTHCPVSLAVVESIDEDKLIYFHVAVDSHTPNFFKERLGQKHDDPMRYSIKIEKLCFCNFQPCMPIIFSIRNVEQSKQRYQKS